MSEATMKRIGLALLLTGLLGACRERSSDWDVLPEDPVSTVGLTGSVAVVDETLDRLVMLTVPSGLSLESQTIELGRHPSAWQASPDRRRLFVLSRGVDSPEEHVAPTLTVVDGSPRPAVCRRFTLDAPHSVLDIDPLGEWVVIRDADSYVQNPNEIILAALDPDADCSGLSDAEREGVVTNRTLESAFGDAPRQLSFTRELSLPDGRRRMLVVERGESVQLLDLRHPAAGGDDQITIEMRRVTETTIGTPVETVYYAGGTDDVPYAWLAVRVQGQPDVLLVEFLPPGEGSDQTLLINTNLANVGGVPSDIEFVMTDRGLRLAALVPQLRRAVLVDPFTSVTYGVDLPAAYDRMSRITEDVTGTAEVEHTDVALLWTEYEPTVAFWSLSQTGTRLYASLDVRNTGIQVSQVLEVTQDPEDEHRHLRVLRGHGANEFRVLDLAGRRDNRLDVEGDASFRMNIAPDARRVWVFPPSGARVISPATLPDGHSEDLVVERDAADVHDVARRSQGRAALVMHQGYAGYGSLGATVFDAESPRSTETRFYGGLLLGGLR